MKAIRIHEYGGPEVLVHEDVPIPHPGESQILVRVEAATVNPIDIAVREDRFPTPRQPPKTLGSDGAGLVESVGAKVLAVRPSDRVFFSGLGIGSEGSYADYALIAETQVVPMPAWLSFVDAAALGMVFPAAYYALVMRGELKDGETALVQEPPAASARPPFNWPSPWELASSPRSAAMSAPISCAAWAPTRPSTTSARRSSPERSRSPTARASTLSTSSS